MQKPKIELRKISFNARLSEETNAYAAQVWADGVHVCDVSNHGHGGSDNVHPAKGKTHDDVKALEISIALTFPKWECLGKPTDMDLEMLCCELLDHHMVGKDLKRSLSKKFLWLKDGSVWEVKKVTGKESIQLTAIKQKQGIDKTLNEMPFEEALAIFRKSAQ